jgi:outer membrane protein assembly factor BamB
MPSRRQVLAGLGISVTTGLTGCLGSGEYDHAADAAGDATDWPTLGHDNHNTGYSPEVRGPSKPTEAWAVTCDYPTGLVVADGHVLLTGQDRVTAYAVEDGSTQWSANVGEGAFTTAPTVHDESAYVGSSRGLHALDVESGEEQWSVKTDGSVSAAPTVGREGERLFFGTTDAAVASASVADQSIEWEIDVFSPVTDALGISGFTLYVPLEGGELHALSADTGERRWRQKLSGAVTAAPAVTDVHAYVGTTGGVDALGPGDAGAIHWTNEEALSTGHLAVAGDTVYATSNAGLTASGRSDDDERTRWTVDGEFYCPPAVAGDTLYVGDERGGVNAFAHDEGLVGGLDGRRRWRHEHGSRVRHVVVTDGRVYGATEPAEERPTLFALSD